MKLLDTVSGCDTGQIEGLSLQLIERLISKDVLVKINHQLIVCEGRHNNPYLQSSAYKALVNAVERRGQKIVINSCLRTVMQQYMLHLQCRRNICGIRAAAKPGRSNHQSGMAIDVADWKSWKPYLENYGWKWLGAWDAVHFDFKGVGVNLGHFQILEFQRLWNEHNPEDKITEDGQWGRVTASKCVQCPPQGFGRPMTLKKGDFSEKVGELQMALRKALGWANNMLAADCHYGAATFKAVALFQKQQGLEIDGIAGVKTLELLKRYG